MRTPQPLSRRDLLRRGGAAALLAAPLLGGAAALTRAEDHIRDEHRGLTAGAGPGPGTLQVTWYAPTTKRAVALTFDDGPSPAYTPRILDHLAEAGAHATFFMVAEHARAHPDLVTRIVAAGHEVGNHTRTHANLAVVGERDVASEIEDAHHILEHLTGSPVRLFRPPYGALSGAALRSAESLGYDLVLWSCALREQQLGVAGNVEHVRAGLRPGAIILAHDAGDARREVGVRALPRILEAVRAGGFAPHTLSDLLRLAPALPAASQ